MSQQKTTPVEELERLSREIQAKRRQVHDALEVSLQASRKDQAGSSPLYRLFASFAGADEWSGTDR